MSEPEEPQRSKDALTELLHNASSGNDAAKSRLMSVVYTRLRRLAASKMKHERADHTLQPTALVNEIYVELIHDNAVTWKDRQHFFATAATAMRRFLVDHARSKARIKHGGGLQKLDLAEAQAGYPSDWLSLIALDRALDRLARVKPEFSQIIDFKFFAGMTTAETALVMGLHPKVVEKKARVARAWLRNEMCQ